MRYVIAPDAEIDVGNDFTKCWISAKHFPQQALKRQVFFFFYYETRLRCYVIKRVNGTNGEEWCIQLDWMINGPLGNIVHS
ncbi:hypothetical protein PUN28_003178 [Cardiocondyla obscurior]|uniref:Uncharacterized protein n=1 Tax=Cardiocondyla obscurior TaxID=286306 RepID=A0AAW2GJM1_9HYME